MEMVIDGKLIDKDHKIKVVNPANNQIVDTVPSGSLEDIKNALEAANQAKKAINDMSSRKVSRILYDIYEDILKNKNELARLVTFETGKPIRDSSDEIKRSVETILLSAEESKRIYE